MLATFVIGLREGLEAALIVGIVAAFLTRNRRPLTAMWWGVGAAVALSIAVGVLLWSVETSLPQAAQEGMETVIGAAAVVFVTGMVLWMNRHGRSMKRELEASASGALGAGTAGALAVMAFLAVLKEGFETSVFLLATFRAAQSAGAAAAGAVLGVLVAIALGIGLYAGGIRLNLSRFFRVTGVFLLLVAAGLALTAVRTAHEAGWLNGGQQRTVDLTWLAPAGSVQSSLLTGVLGIPGDPRLIEVVVWLAYLVPTALVVYWPARRRPAGRAATRTRLGVAAGLVGTGLVLAIAVPVALAPATAPATLALRGGGSARLDGDRVVVTDASGRRTAVTVAGAGDLRGSSTASAGTTTITLQQLVAASGGRLPVGMDAATDPGPFTARTSTVTTVTARAAAGRLTGFSSTAVRVAQLSGGGLAATRTVTLGSTGRTATAASSQAAEAAAGSSSALAPERLLWAVQVPLALAAAGLLLVLSTLLRSRRRAPSPTLRPAGSSSYAVK